MGHLVGHTRRRRRPCNVSSRRWRRHTPPQPPPSRRAAVAHDVPTVGGPHAEPHGRPRSLASHAGGLAAQLRAVRYAAAVALHLSRSLVLPPLLFMKAMPRDPSGGENSSTLRPGLLSNGCKLTIRRERELPAL